MPAPSRLVGRIVFWAIMLGAISLAAAVLGVGALTAFVGAIWAYLPNVLAAVLIFLAASAIAAAVVALVSRTMGETALGKIVATAVPILVMTIATFMILEQLKIAHDIVVTTYTLLLGAIALGTALAFGLGGRDVAARMLEGAYAKGQENKEQYRRDLDTGMTRAQGEMEQKKDALRDQDARPTVPRPAGTGDDNHRKGSQMAQQEMNRVRLDEMRGEPVYDNQGEKIGKWRRSSTTSRRAFPSGSGSALASSARSGCSFPSAGPRRAATA